MSTDIGYRGHDYVAGNQHRGRASFSGRPRPSPKPSRAGRDGRYVSVLGRPTAGNRATGACERRLAARRRGMRATSLSSSWRWERCSPSRSASARCISPRDCASHVFVRYRTARSTSAESSAERSELNAKPVRRQAKTPRPSCELLSAVFYGVPPLASWRLGVQFHRSDNRGRKVNQSNPTAGLPIRMS